MTNVARYFQALLAQVEGRTEESLRLTEGVEPMQSGDAIEIVQAVLLHPRKRDLLDLLVNSAIVGMTDQRCATAQDLLTVALGENPKKN